MNQHYEKIRLACIAKNPSILAPKMGCEVDLGGFSDKTIVGLSDHGYGESNPGYIVVGGNVLGQYDEVGYTTQKQIKKVIGRPITPQDVLLALGDKNAIWGDGMLYFQIEDDMGPVYDDKGNHVFVDMSKPLLRDQSPEVLEWIAERLS